MVVRFKGGLTQSNKVHWYQDGFRPYKSINEIPNLDRVDPNSDLYDYVKQNLKYPRLIAQAIDTGVTGKVSWKSETTKTDFLAAYGFKNIKKLGAGKDGITSLCTRYLDEPKTRYIVKVYRANGERYVKHTEHIMEVIKSSTVRPVELIDFITTQHFSLYECSDAFSTIERRDWLTHLSNVCNMNAWLIEHGRCLFWDFGFNSGLNYMQAPDGSTRWVDYGGAGIVHLKDLNTKEWLNCHEPFEDKQCLVIADDHFILCQFVFHIEYWNARFDNRTSTSDLWSSMIQLRKDGLRDVYKVIDSLLVSQYAKDILTQFKDKPFTDPDTWRQISVKVKNL